MNLSTPINEIIFNPSKKEKTPSKISYREIAEEILKKTGYTPTIYKEDIFPLFLVTALSSSDYKNPVIIYNALILRLTKEANKALKNNNNALVMITNLEKAVYLVAIGRLLQQNNFFVAENGVLKTKLSDKDIKEIEKFFQNIGINKTINRSILENMLESIQRKAENSEIMDILKEFGETITPETLKNNKKFAQAVQNIEQIFKALQEKADTNQLSPEEKKAFNQTLQGNPKKKKDMRSAPTQIIAPVLSM